VSTPQIISITDDLRRCASCYDVGVPDDQAHPPIEDRLAYLLKHARLRLAALSGPALEPLGVDGRELAVLTVIGSGPPPSQLEAARRLGVDRTTMVGLIDGLEAQGLAARHPDARDRRRNVVTLTERGDAVLRAGVRATDAVEAAFLGDLTPAEAATLRRLLQRLLHAERQGSRTG
jgi:DNA-binding MarR family transcriptional regulator